MTTHSIALVAGRGTIPAVDTRTHDLSTARFGWTLLAVIVAFSAAGFHFGFLWWMTAVTTLGFIAAFLGLVRPALGLFGITIICTLDSISRQFLFDGTIHYLRFNTFNYFLLAVMVAHQGLIRRLSDWQTRLIIGFVALLTVELVFSERMNRGAQHILGIATLFGLLVYFVRAAARERAWYWQGLLGGVTGALGGMLYNTDGTMPNLNHNVYAAFPETAIFAVCLAFGFAADRREEFILVGLAAVCMVWVFLSGSRGGLFISLAAMVFLILSMKGGGKKIMYVVAAIAIGLLVTNRFTELKTTSMTRWEKMWSSEETADARTSGRTSLALGGWHIFLDHPLGVGTGGSELAWSRLDYVEGISDLKAGQEFSLHSGWMKVLAENGIPGIILFIAVVGSFAFAGWRTGDPFLRMLGCAVTLTLAIAFVSTEFQSKAFWFLSAGALTLLQREPMIAAVRGGKRRRVWWVRPAMPRGALRPRVVDSDPSQPLPRPVRVPRPLL